MTCSDSQSCDFSFFMWMVVGTLAYRLNPNLSSAISLLLVWAFFFFFFFLLKYFKCALNNFCFKCRYMVITKLFFSWCVNLLSNNPCWRKHVSFLYLTIFKLKLINYVGKICFSHFFPPNNKSYPFGGDEVGRPTDSWDL